MREPWFWYSNAFSAKTLRALLTPASAVYGAAHHLRWALSHPRGASTPVICIGNASLGGTGKTPFAIMVKDLLSAEGLNSVFLTRGYGGALAGPARVDLSKHSSDDVGDEALLLARHAPTVVSRNRPDGADLAAKCGADAIIMDDGYQNPSLHKDFSILLANANAEASKQHVFPAGPWRETLADARARADIVVSICADKTEAESITGSDHKAWLEPAGTPPPQRVIAFAGIGRPHRFFNLLEAHGFETAKRFAFPDHHRFGNAELSQLRRAATSAGAALITTEKDLARLAPRDREGILTLPVEMRINDPQALTQRLLECIAERAKQPDNA